MYHLMTGNILAPTYDSDCVCPHCWPCMISRSRTFHAPVPEDAHNPLAESNAVVAVSKGGDEASESQPPSSPRPTSLPSRSDQALVFMMGRTRISWAPCAASSSMTTAIRFFSTMALMAHHSGSSSGDSVGARLPGVMALTCSTRFRGTLYWQRTYFCAAFRCVLVQKLANLALRLTDEPCNPRRDEIHKLLIRDSFRPDEDCFAVHDRIDGHQPGCLHGFTRF